MNGRSFWHRLKLRCLSGSLALVLGLTSRATAQVPDTLPPIPQPQTADGFILQKDERPKEERPAPAPAPAPAAEAPPAASCSTCGTGRRIGHGLGGGLFNTSCGGTYCGDVSYPCGYSGCFPGHKNCCSSPGGCGACGGGGCGSGCGSCFGDGPISRFFSCFYQCLCCPDPCYEPRYIPEANSAFWVDSARPLTISRFRYESGRNFTQPDRSEWFWAKTGLKGPRLAESSVKYDALKIYQEVATKKASFFIEQDYRSVDPDVNRHGSGWGDMNLGTKSLLFDCELMQVGFQFKTYLPVGQAGKGLGTGHVALEPSLLLTIKLLRETYFQSQIAEWIPIAGDPHAAGSILHYHFAINHVIWRPMDDMPIILGVEANAYSFQDGEFTDPNGIPHLSSGETWWNFGPSLRVSLCNRIDFGFSGVFNMDADGPRQVYRTDFRFRF